MGNLEVFVRRLYLIVCWGAGKISLGNWLFWKGTGLIWEGSWSWIMSSASVWGSWGVLGVCWPLQLLALSASAHSLICSRALALPTAG